MGQKETDRQTLSRHMVRGQGKGLSGKTRSLVVVVLSFTHDKPPKEKCQTSIRRGEIGWCGEES